MSDTRAWHSLFRCEAPYLYEVFIDIMTEMWYNNCTLGRGTMGPMELAEAMAANKMFRDRITGEIFIFISVDGMGNIGGLTIDGKFSKSHAKNLEVVEPAKSDMDESNQSNINEDDKEPIK